MKTKLKILLLVIILASSLQCVGAKMSFLNFVAQEKATSSHLDAKFAKVSESAARPLEELKKQKSLGWLIFELVPKESGGEVEVIDSGTDANWEEFVSKLKDDTPALGLIRFIYKTNENPPREADKIVAVVWINTHKTNLKLKYRAANAVGEVLKQIGGVQKTIQAADKDDLRYEEIRKEILKAR